MLESHRKLDALIWRFVAEQDYARFFQIDDPEDTRFFQVFTDTIEITCIEGMMDLTASYETFEISEFEAWVDQHG